MSAPVLARQKAENYMDNLLTKHREAKTAPARPLALTLSIYCDDSSAVIRIEEVRPSGRLKVSANGFQTYTVDGTWMAASLIATTITSYHWPPGQELIVEGRFGQKACNTATASWPSSSQLDHKLITAHLDPLLSFIGNVFDK